MEAEPLRFGFTTAEGDTYHFQVRGGARVRQGCGRGLASEGRGLGLGLGRSVGGDWPVRGGA